jgi:hypothetical protein
MARSIGGIVFADGTRLFCVFDHTVGCAMRALFSTSDEAWAWYEDESLEYLEPKNAASTEEVVQLLIDVSFETNANFWFPSRASKKDFWLTGPCSREEVMSEHPDVLW